MLTLYDIMQTVNKRTFYRGQQYFNERKVLYADIDDDGHVTAEVLGNYESSYFLDISLKLGSHGQLVSLEGRCTCPVGYNCKHVVASLCSVQAQQKGRNLKIADPSSPQLLAWLKQSPPRHGKQDGSSKNAVVPHKAPRDRLVYVVRDGENGRAEIVPFKGFVKKNGEFGANTREYDYYPTHDSRRKPAFLTVEDVGILARLNLFRQQVGYAGSNDTFTRDLTTDFLREIVETGNARGGDVNGPVLFWAPPRSASVGWSQGAEGMQTVKFRDSEDSSISLLHFSVPIYYDPISGAIGPAETGLDKKTLEWLVSAPAVPPESTRFVAKKIRGLNGVVPPPKVWKIKKRRDLKPVPHLTLYGLSVEEDFYRPRRQRQHRQETCPPTVYPCARLSLSYGNLKDTVKQGLGGSRFRSIEGDELSVVHRDRRQERQLLMRLENEAIQFGGGRPDNSVVNYQHLDCLYGADIAFPPKSGQLAGNHMSGLMFANATIPDLRDEGWKVEIDPSWPYKVYDGPVTFSTSLESSEGSIDDWFSFSLKLEADGQEVEFVPLILKVIDSLPLDEFGALQEGEDVHHLLSGSIYYLTLPDGSHAIIEGERIAPFVEAFLEAQGLFGFHVAEGEPGCRLGNRT